MELQKQIFERKQQNCNIRYGYIEGGSVKDSQLYDNMVQSKRAYKNEIKIVKLHEKEKKNKYIET